MATPPAGSRQLPNGLAAERWKWIAGLLATNLVTAIIMFISSGFAAGAAVAQHEKMPAHSGAMTSQVLDARLEGISANGKAIDRLSEKVEILIDKVARLETKVDALP